MSNKVSIVIPVYNMEKFISRCIDSVLRQTYNNIEIVIINDGSTDNTALICREYTSQNKSIIYKEKNNGGVADALNYGIKLSSGEFLFFLDADDYINYNTLELLVNVAIRENADIVQCGAVLEKIDGTVIMRDTQNQIEYNGREEILCRYAYDGIIKGNLAQKIIRRELFGDIQLPKGRNIVDLSTMILVFARSTRYYIIPDALYHAVKRDESVSMRALDDKSYDDMVYYINIIHNLYASTIELSVKEALTYMEATNVRACYIRVFNSDAISDKKEKLLELENKCSECLKKLHRKSVMRQVSILDWILLYGFNICPRLYATLRKVICKKRK